MSTPSPSFPFRQPSELPDALELAGLDPQEREERQKAVQKFLERAEFSKLTRALRARLSYASYKATHNLSHLPLPVLENRLQTPSPAPSPTPTPPSPSKRRSAPAAITTMPPPGSPSSNLYSTLLGPPAQKRPRHIYGPALTSSLSSSSITPSRSPTPADLLSAYSATPAHSPATPRSKARAATGTTISSSTLPGGAGGAMPSSPFSSATGRTVRNAIQGRARNTLTEKEDMNAAATLTALMYTNRASPRQQHQQPQSTVLLQPGPSSSSSFQQGGSTLCAVEDPSSIIRATTPISNTKTSEDADAAELMLYLATSPSPARPTTSSMPRRTPTSMGRILFADESEMSESPSVFGGGGGDSGATSTAYGFASGASSPNKHSHSHSNDDGHSDGKTSMDMDVDKVDRGDGIATPILTFSQSSQESTTPFVLAPPPSLRSPALAYASASPTKPSSFGASRKLFMDGEDTRRIMGIATGTYTPNASIISSHHRDDGGGDNNSNPNASANTGGGFTLGKGIDLVEAK